MGGSIVMVVNNSVVEIECSPNKQVNKLKKPKTRLRESKIIVQRRVESIESCDTDSCISVWQSVVVQALYDLISVAENHEQKVDRANAVAWFGQGVGKDCRQTDLQTLYQYISIFVYIDILI